MASISREKNGCRRIQFFGADGERQGIRLGKVSKRTAESVKVHVERLVMASITGFPIEDETARWIAGLESVMLAKLENVGLIQAKERRCTKADAPQLVNFIDDYIASRVDVKTGTREIYQQIRRNLIEHFGADRRIDSISEGCAAEFRLSLIKQGLAEATVRRRCGLAKQLFRMAVKKRLLAANPFDGLVSTAKGNPERFYFVSPQEIYRIIDKCPNIEWKLMIALSRFGGLRCPSEVLELKWTDIDWEHNRIRVPSPKTAHHEGKSERMIPLFPELIPFLREAFEAAKPGTEWVITRYRNTRANLRTRLERIIYNAGLVPWPKPWQNMRSTRQTELADHFPAHVVCAWIGNSEAVATEHYLQVTGEHFERAVNPSGAPVVHRVVQNPVQQAHAQGGMAYQPGESKPGFQPNAAGCSDMQLTGTGPQGFEP